MDSFHNSFMEQGLAHVSVHERNAADAQSAEGEGNLKLVLFSAPSPDLIQIQLVQVHDHDTGTHEEGQFDDGMVYHMEQKAGQSNGVPLFTPCSREQDQHSDACQDETDLRHGRTCKRALEVDRKDTQDSAEQHGDHAGDQDDRAEHIILHESMESDHENSVNTDFGQDAREQCRGR